MKRWFHCYTNTSVFGFCINENNIVVDVDFPEARKNVLWKSIKDPTVRQWFKNNTTIIYEVK